MKKYFILLTLLAIVSLTFLIVRKNRHEPISTVIAGSTIQQTIVPTPPITQETLCKTDVHTTPTPDEISFNQYTSGDPYVQYLRTAINYYLNNDYSTGAQYNGLVDGVHNPDTAYNQLQAIGEDYLRSKFIVINVDASQFGGDNIVLIFKDKPDQIFYALVDNYQDKSGKNRGFDLDLFLPYSLVAVKDAPDLQTMQKTYIDLICDPNFGI